MTDLKATQDRIDSAANWYDSENDFDRVLIAYSWFKIRDRARGRTALELGSADGLMTRELASHFAEVTVVEGAEVNAEKIRKHLPDVDVHHCVFEKFQTEKRFDNIIAARVLEHIDDPVGTLRTFAKFLAPGGVIHIVVPNAESFNRKLGHAMGMLENINDLTKRDVQAGHVRVYRRDELVQHVRDAGLVPVEVTGTFLKLLSNEQMMGWSQEVIEGLYRMSDELPQYCTEIYVRATNSSGD